MTEYLEVLSGLSPKLTDLCLRIQKEYMQDACSSKWATFGIHSIFLCKDRIAYQSEILLGVGITDYATISLWEGAGICYLLYFLIYGPEDKFDRKVWKIINVKPDYGKSVFRPMDFYVKFVYKTIEELENVLLKYDVDTACKVTMQRAKYVKAKDDFSTYPAFAPDLSETDLSVSITDCINAVAHADSGVSKNFPRELWGEWRYCSGRAEQLCSKSIISVHKDPRVLLFSKGERIFDEALSVGSATGILPYDVARIRRIYQKIGAIDNDGRDS